MPKHIVFVIALALSSAFGLEVSDKLEERLARADALKRSLYWQGAGEYILDILENKCEFDSSQHADTAYFYDIPRSFEMSAPLKVRDAAKAFAQAQAALAEGGEKKPLVLSNLANLYLCGIGVEKDTDKALGLLKDCKAFLHSAEDFKSFDKYSYQAQYYRESKIPDDEHIYFYPLIAYLYYRGIGVERDAAKCNAILRHRDSFSSWRNFYIGYLVPRDFEFALHILSVSDTAGAAYEAMKLFEGSYNPADADEVRAREWRNECAERLEEHGRKINAVYYEYYNEQMSEVINEGSMPLNLLAFAGDRQFIIPIESSDRANPSHGSVLVKNDLCTPSRLENTFAAIERPIADMLEKDPALLRQVALYFTCMTKSEKRKMDERIFIYAEELKKRAAAKISEASARKAKER